jgi:hypothetical protein
MTTTLKRYVLAVSLAVRFALAAANGAAEPYPEAPPAVSAPPPPPATRSAPNARSTSAGADAGARSGQVINESPLTLYQGEVA